LGCLQTHAIVIYTARLENRIGRNKHYSLILIFPS